MPDVDYECNFNFFNNFFNKPSEKESTIVMEIMTSPVTKTGDMFTCPVPTNLPAIPHMEGETIPETTHACTTKELSFELSLFRCVTKQRLPALQWE